MSLIMASTMVAPYADEYTTDAYQWWHLSEPSPEVIEATDVGWLSPTGYILDLGCGLGTESAYLASRGATAVGIDLSAAALRKARSEHTDVRFVQGDVLRLPFRQTFDAAIDRGCFHYIPPESRRAYADEVARVVRPGGQLLLRACLRAAGERNDIDDGTVRESFSSWSVIRMVHEDIPSDTRRLEAITVWLARP